MSNMPNTFDELESILAEIIKIVSALFDGLASFTAGFKKQYPYQTAEFDAENYRFVD